MNFTCTNYSDDANNLIKRGIMNRLNTLLKQKLLLLHLLAPFILNNAKEVQIKTDSKKSNSLLS